MHGKAFCVALILQALIAVEVANSAEPGQQQYSPCVTGPNMLRQVDDWERQGMRPDIRDDQTGRPMHPEEAAEIFIADCSEQISKLALAASLMKDSTMHALVTMWRNNLTFMKWWLQNRREKNRKR